MAGDTPTKTPEKGRSLSVPSPPPPYRSHQEERRKSGPLPSNTSNPAENVHFEAPLSSLTNKIEDQERRHDSIADSAKQTAAAVANAAVEISTNVATTVASAAKGVGENVATTIGSLGASQPESGDVQNSNASTAPDKSTEKASGESSVAVEEAAGTGEQKPVGSDGKEKPTEHDYGVKSRVAVDFNGDAVVELTPSEGQKK